MLGSQRKGYLQMPMQHATGPPFPSAPRRTGDLPPAPRIWSLTYRPRQLGVWSLPPFQKRVTVVA